MITRKCKHFNDYKLIQVLCKNKIMTTNILYTQDKLTSLAYFEGDPYTDVSVSSDYTYNNTNAKAEFAIDNQRFNKFLVDEVFKISYNNGEVQKTFTSNDYIQGITFAKNVDDTIDYDRASSYYKINTPNYMDIFSHSAGTIFTSIVNNKFNIGVIFDETFSFNEDGSSISSVNIELRNEEPLMQSIVDCNGKVYDFKKGVKLSDFSKFIEQKTEGTPVGYVDFNSIAPSNISTNKTNSESGTQSTNTINKIYKLETPQEPQPIYVSNTSDLFSNNKSLTRFNGYIVFCSFNTEPDLESESLLQYKPYITVFRYINCDIPIYLNSIEPTYDSYNNLTNIMKLEHRLYKPFSLKDTFIYNSAFYSSFKSSIYDTTTTYDTINNYYILGESIKND